MVHDISLISTIAVGFALAFFFGTLAHGLKLPPLVGYLVAGIAIGPHTPGFRGDGNIAAQLAEIGVMLLMFGVGLHFSVRDLLAVRRLAIPGAVVQILLATVLGAALTHLWGWTLGEGLVFGLSLSVASTVVLLKALEERNAVATPNGRIAIGWLIVEDLAMVLALVLVPALAPLLGGHAAGDGHGGTEADPVWLTLVVTLVKVSVFVAIALLVGPRILPWILRQVARTGSRELFTLCVLALALGIAFGSAKLFGVSFALGAFFAGMVLNESDLSHKAAANSLPLQDAFAVLFFVSVGMVFDPTVVVREPLMVLGVLGLIILGKSLISLVLALALGYPISTALMVSAALAQVGEFSFILAGLGKDLGLLPGEGFNLVLAGALFSITLNPLVFAAAERASAAIRRRPRAAATWETSRRQRLEALTKELEAVRRQNEERAAAHKTFSPEELVDRFPLFAGLTPEQREVLILHFEPRTAEPGDRIIRQGDAADLVYFISAGEVEVRVSDRRIKLGAGDFFGEMALISGQPRSADVIALDYCKFATLSQRDFRALLRRFPSMREHIARLAAERGEMNRQVLEEAEA
jgi:monovalent cation:H+ antiporter-2, CPA2 family